MRPDTGSIDNPKGAQMMSKRSLIAIATLAALGLQAGLAQAQPRERHDRAPAPVVHVHHHVHTVHHPAPHAGKGKPPAHARHQVKAPPRWRPGDRLPAVHRAPAHVVKDWRHHRLSAPPRGHEWVRVGTDFALVAVASGIIEQIVVNL